MTMADKNTVEIYFRKTVHHDSWYADWTHDSVGSVMTIRVDDTLSVTASDKQLQFLTQDTFSRQYYSAEYKSAGPKTFVITR